MIQEMTDTGISVTATEEELEALQRYTPRDNKEILHDIRERFEADPGDYREVTIEVDNGFVSLTGLVKDIALKRHAEALANSVEGVIEVDNAIYTDQAITVCIRKAIMEDPRTDISVIEVESKQGKVVLSGQVDSEELKGTLASLALDQEGVTEVENKLRVAPDADTDYVVAWGREARHGWKNTIFILR
jgi:osmotically-inducible protein OsmY